MLSKLRLFSKYSQLVKTLSPVNILKSNVRRYGVDKPDVIDINFEDMMYEESEFETCDRMLSEDPPLRSTGFDGIPIAPVDINPWIEEEEYKQGTVYEETVERKKVISELPEPPKEKDRSGIYKFKGIKILLPKKLLKAATFRYRFDQEDELLADDIRICKFEKW